MRGIGVKRLFTAVAVAVALLIGASVVGVGVAHAASDFDARMAAAKKRLDMAEETLKTDRKAGVIEVMAVFNQLKYLYRERPNSPDVSLMIARCYWYNDRQPKAKRALEKAFLWDRTHVDALIFKGEIALYENRFSMSERKVDEAFEEALSLDGLSPEKEGSIYLKLGDFYGEAAARAKFSARKKEAYEARAREYWQKAADAAPGGQASEEAKRRLGGV